MKPIDLQLQKPESERHYCWRPEEVQAMVDLAKKSPELAWLYAVIVGLACSGLRIGELASLRWHDLDLERRVIQLTDERGHRRQEGRARRTVKNRRSRSFPIHPDWAVVLEGISKVDAYIYHGPRGGRLKPDTARNALKEYVIEPLIDRFPSVDDEQGFKDGRFHSFRHFFCSSCANTCIPERMVMEWLGHQDSEMVRHYYHLNDQESRRRMDQLNPLGGDVEGRSDAGSQD
jgi:integrase